jgi:LysR family hydrogen peroxide-inducible transcriptional activator
MYRPSLRQLECLVAVDDARHFGRAARACAVTQPALSAQIRSLEEGLGVRLFERSRRGVLPTRAGTRVVAAARDALRGVDQLVSVAEASREALAGPLHLGVIPTLAPYLLPEWLAQVRAGFPKLRLYLHEDRTARIVQDLREGRLDLLLLALPVPGADLVCRELFAEPFVLAAPSAHPLARRRRVAETDLAGETVLLLEDGHCLRDQALAVCELAGAREAEGVRASSLNTLVQMVASGLGLTLLPRCAVETELRGGVEVSIRPFRAPPPRRSVGLAWRRGAQRDEEFARLGALLKRCSAAQPGA